MSLGATSYSWGRHSGECFLLTNSTLLIPDWSYNSGVLWDAAPAGSVPGLPLSTSLWVGAGGGGANPSPSSTAAPAPSPGCAALYRALPRTDLVGTLIGNAWYPGTSLPASSESSCRQACCDAPSCNAYTFALNDLQLMARQGLSETASCFLYTNVTALVPSSVVNSGALLSAYS